MFNLHVIQARFGDCFLLEYGEAVSEYILVDGGPLHNYDDYLKPALAEILKDRSGLEAVIISHADNDHILGIVDLLTDLKYRKDTGAEPFIHINQVWFNSFKATVDNGEFEKRMKSINSLAGVNGINMQEMNIAFTGIREGYQLLTLARFLEIPVNPGAEEGSDGNRIWMASKDHPVFRRPGLEITLAGPTRENLVMLQKEWEEWIQKNEEKIREGKYTPDFAAMADRSIPNLSSIVLYINAGGTTVLLTGDCRGDHLQQGLTETGLTGDGHLHVHIFKVPHHGSKRNVTRKFFEEVTADVYIISADGTNDNPNDETLTWIVETAREAGRKIRLALTNETPSSASLLGTHDPGEWNYELEILPRGKKSFPVIPG